MASSWLGRHVLAVDDFDDAMLSEVFSTAAKMKRMVKEKGAAPILAGRILANVFYEPSTRTMCSFDAAMKRLGGQVISVSESSSSAKKGETIEDTVRCLQCYCDVLVLRHPEKGTAARAASAASKPVINAGDGVGEHPTQALLDLFTTFNARDNGSADLSGLTLTLVGDLKHGRTVHSLSLLASKASPPPRILCVSPQPLAMPEHVTATLRSRGVQVEETTDLRAALPSTDVLYVTRVQRERFADEEEYKKHAGSYVVDKQLMELAPAHMMVLHPLPRVDEIATDVDADPRAKYFEQMENGMYVRMALLALVLGADLTALGD
uniref:aspartate carbamoyltransferase n=1 Tax=Chrysotila carterae TaxID=13221 RepID=A0A7S4B7J6_CHRCT